MPHVLLVTTADDLAADLLVMAARRREIPLVRFNQEDFPDRAGIRWSSGGEVEIRIANRRLRTCDVSGAWFRREAPEERCTVSGSVESFASREAAGFLTGVWETSPWPWMNKPSAVSRAENKLLQLVLARRLGLAVPETVVTNCADDARQFVRGRSSIAKAVVGGSLAMSGRQYMLYTTHVNEYDLTSDRSLESAPVIYQERILKLYDIRVTVVRDRVFAARICVEDRTDKDVDWRAVEDSRLRYEEHILPEFVSDACVRLVRDLGLSFGALDFVVTNCGQHFFLELNPSGQWGWIERQLGQPITATILDCLARIPS